MSVNNVGAKNFAGKLQDVDVIQSAKTLATDTKGTKALTLDKEGKLTTVDLNEKNKDGKVMKFFKGMTNKAYREENKALKEMRKTAKDPGFVKALKHKVFSEATFATGLRGSTGKMGMDVLGLVGGGKTEDVKFYQLFEKVTADKTGLTPNDIANSMKLTELSSEMFDAALGKVAFNVKGENGESQNIVDFIKNNTSKDTYSVQNLVKGASMQSINVAVLNAKKNEGSVQSSLSPSIDLTSIGTSLKSAIDSKSPTQGKDVSLVLSQGMNDMMKHLKGLVETGQKNGLDNQKIADKMFNYCLDINRLTPLQPFDPDPYRFGDRRVTPEMTE